MRTDPYLAYNFAVELQGIIVGGFSEISGLQITTEVEKIREGGTNDFIHILPKETTYSNIILKYGLTDVDSLWVWYKDVINGIVTRKNGSIHLLDHTGEIKKTWNFYEAYPIRWEGAAFNATSSVVAVATIELVHHGYEVG